MNRLIVLFLWGITHTFVFSAESFSFKIEPYCATQDTQTIQSIAEENAELIFAQSYSAHDLMESVNAGQGKVFVARDDSTKNSIGFVFMNIKDVKFLSFYMATGASIECIAVAKKFQGHNVGTALFTQALRYAQEQNAHFAKLCVKPSNENACRFYEKQGFSCTVSLEQALTQPVIYYSKNFSVSSDAPYKGNIIQCYPKTMVSIAGLTLGTYYLWKK